MSETTTADTSTTSAETATTTTADTGATLLTSATTAATETTATSAETSAETTKAAEVVAPVVPEKYEFKAPEGVTFDQAQVEAFTPIAKELGLTNEQAQKIVDLHLANSQAAQAAQHAQWQGVVKQWEADTRADKEIGGVKFDENIGIAAKAIDKYGSRELRQALDTSGMGNHPAVVKFFVNVGRQVVEDGMLNGAAGQGGKSTAEVLFPSMFPQK